MCCQAVKSREQCYSLVTAASSVAVRKRTSTIDIVITNYIYIYDLHSLGLSMVGIIIQNLYVSRQSVASVLNSHVWFTIYPFVFVRCLVSLEFF